MANGRRVSLLPCPDSGNECSRDRDEERSWNEVYPRLARLRLHRGAVLKIDPCELVLFAFQNARTLVTAINDTDTDEEMVAKPLSECFEESASDPVEVMLPRQDLGISISAKYSANKLTELFRDSTNSDSEDEEGGVVVQWTVNELSGNVRGFRLFWFNSKHQEKIEVLLPLDATSYEIWSALQR